MEVSLLTILTEHYPVYERLNLCAEKLFADTCNVVLSGCRYKSANMSKEGLTAVKEIVLALCYGLIYKAYCTDYKDYQPKIIHHYTHYGISNIVELELRIFEAIDFDLRRYKPHFSSTLVFMDPPKGKIRVGRIDYSTGKPVHPTYEGFTPIVVLTKSSPYGSLGPYVLTDLRGRIMENIYQGSKWYPWVPKVIQYYSKWNKTVIWEHPQEIHATKDPETNLDIPTKEYGAWRRKLMFNKYGVRYPVGEGSHRSTCLGIVKENGRRYDYIEGRKKVYLKIYARLVKRQPQYLDLYQRLRNGENLLIMEVDGPRREYLNYYKEKYGVGDNFIEKDTMLFTIDNNKLMLNDQIAPYGHGYCLASCLMDWS
jgi:hypothetical protein